MGDIDKKIEDHRRDPDPHPRLKKDTDKKLASIITRLDAIDEHGKKEALQLGNSVPTTVDQDGQGSSGISTVASREDHKHALDDITVRIPGTGTVQVNEDGGEAEATQSPSVTGTSTAGTVVVNDQAGTGIRLVAAESDGTQKALPEAVWTPGGVPVRTVEIFAANQEGISGARVNGAWETMNLPGGKSISCAAWSGQKWFAVSSDGYTYSSADGIIWTQLSQHISVPTKLVALDDVVVANDFMTGVKVSLDGGATWQSHIPYTIDPSRFNSCYIMPLPGGGYRIFVCGQAGTGWTSGIIAMADTESMPTPGALWAKSFWNQTATVMHMSKGPNGGVYAISTGSSTTVQVMFSVDGVNWSKDDTVISGYGRSVYWSDLYNLIFIGLTQGGLNGEIAYYPPEGGNPTLALSGFGGAIDSFAECKGKLFCGANYGGAWEITPTTKTKVASGVIQFVSAIGFDGVLSKAKLDLDASLEANSLTIIDQAGDGTRMVAAKSFGLQVAIPEVVWRPGLPKNQAAANNLVCAICQYGRVIYVSGQFSQLNNQAHAGICAFDADTGAVLPLNITLGGARAEALVCDGEYLYAGGAFANVAGVSRTDLVRIRLSDLAVDATFPQANGIVRSVSLFGDYLLVAGDFSEVGGVYTTSCAAIHRQTKAVTAITNNGAVVHRVAAGGDRAVFVGVFTTFLGQSRSGAAVIDADLALTGEQFATLNTANGGAAGVSPDGTLMVAGDYAGTVSAYKVGVGVKAMPAANGPIYGDIIIRGSLITCTGNFNLVVGNTRTGFVEMDYDTAAVTGTVYNAGAVVMGHVFDDEILWMVGTFLAVNGKPGLRIYNTLPAFASDSLAVAGVVEAMTIKVADQAGTGVRLVVARSDGKQDTLSAISESQVAGLGSDLSAINARLDALEYIAPDISNLSNNIGTVEIGSTVSTVVLSWSLNKTMTTESISSPGPGSITPSLLTYSIGGLSLTADQSFTVTVGDDINTDAASTSVYFRRKRHWGVSATETPDSATIAALSGAEFSTSRAQSRGMSPSAEYLYFAWPSSFGTPSFTVNGLPVSGWIKTTISYTNPSGHTENYDIYRSQYLQTGTFTVVVS